MRISIRDGGFLAARVERAINRRLAPFGFATRVAFEPDREWLDVRTRKTVRSAGHAFDGQTYANQMVIPVEEIIRSRYDAVAVFVERFTEQTILSLMRIFDNKKEERDERRVDCPPAGDPAAGDVRGGTAGQRSGEGDDDPRPYVVVGHDS